MTRDEIIEMAIQAGFDWSGKHLTWEFAMCDEEIEAFAKLVAQHEREVCAKVCEDLSNDMTPIAEQAAKACATFIRGQT